MLTANPIANQRSSSRNPQVLQAVPDAMQIVSAETVSRRASRSGVRMTRPRRLLHSRCGSTIRRRSRIRHRTVSRSVNPRRRLRRCINQPRRHHRRQQLRRNNGNLHRRRSRTQSSLTMADAADRRDKA
jgi:hypothetical protein